MAEFSYRVAQNIPGKFYVDDTCIYCDLCREIAPTIFSEENEFGWATVFRQPVTPEEFRLATDALEMCPTESIGSDGDQHDWNEPIKSQ